MSTKLTPQQKEWKLLQDRILTHSNRIKSAHQFHKIKTYKDYLIQAGFTDDWIRHTYHTSELDTTLSFNDIKDLLLDYSLGERVALWLKHNPPDTSDIPRHPLSSQSQSPNDNNPIVSNGHVEVLPPHKGELPLATITSTEEPKHDDTYGLEPRKNSKVFLFWFQKKAVKRMLDMIYEDKLRAILLISGTGSGKTYMIGELLRRLLDMKFTADCLSPWPIIWVTKASIVEQTERVVRDKFDIDPINEVTVINIDQLRSKLGEIFIKEEIKIEDGQERIQYRWRPTHPMIMIFDECQILKNSDSQQSRIAQAFNDFKDDNTLQIFVSATPFTRVAEAKCFSVATRVRHNYGAARDIPLINDHWNDFAAEVAHPADPLEHSPAAIERLMDRLDNYVVRVKGIKTQFNPINNVQIIDFATPEDKLYYDQAWKRYLEEKAKLESEGEENFFNILVQFLKFRQAAELCRAKILAKAMYESVHYHGQAATCALNFKGTIIKVVKCLIEDYGVTRDDISLIWGGGAKVKTKKQYNREKIAQDEEALAILKDAGMTDEDLHDLALDEVEEDVMEGVPDDWRMGMQSKKERQKEIDRFQSGKSKYCLFTFKSGGVGLSLHHTDEFTKEKCRRKDSGYAFVEDIPLIPTRPRVCFLAPTYSAMELVQGLGRCPRLTSLSDTPQTVLFFRGTIEEDVAKIVSMKLRCLSKVVRQRESWEDVVLGKGTGSASREANVIKHLQDKIEDGADTEEDNNPIVDEGDED